MKRREFIILTGAGATSASLLSACGHPEDRLIPALVPDDKYVPGLDYWKASTCSMCSASCGIIVRTREHKANKIEGNPLHPVNRGGLCARGQAGLQSLYNPDRIRSPLRRAGERGRGQFEEISWEEAIKTLAGKLREIKASGNADRLLFATAGSPAVNHFAVELFMQAYGSSTLLLLDVFNGQWDMASYQESYGAAGTPIFDIANSTYLLSFGARFLETWRSPVMYSLAYGEFRRSAGRARGRFVQVEPRMSLTAANADEWLPAAPGSEGLLALAVAQVILREGLIKDAKAPDFLKTPLDEHAPEKVAEKVDIPAERIIRIAREFAAAERPLAIGGGAAASSTGGIESMRAINFLNTLAGNLNKPGGVLLPAAADFDPLASLRADSALFDAARPYDNLLFDHAQALLIHHANPLYTAPSLADAIKQIPFIASFSSFMDETSQMADLVLPDHTYLESWDIRPAYAGNTEAVATLTRPVIEPEHDTRQTADVIIALGREMGLSEMAQFESSEDMVRRAAAKLPIKGGSFEADSAETFWETFLERGVWSGRIEPGSEAKPARGFYAPNPDLQQIEMEIASADEYPLVLLAYEHAALGTGKEANLPLLQELPDPMTSVMWGSWVEINPKTAASLGLSEGDTVEVQTPAGSVRAPVVIYPAIRPDVIAMPSGQGHSALGRYASGRGASATLLDPWMINPDVIPVTIRARVSKVEGEARLVKFGTSLPEHLEIKR
jgi:anaerobic selenocysteine-containing dehydrogenase